MSEWTAILDDLTTYLRWQQECGLRTEEFEPQTLKEFLAATPAKGAVRILTTVTSAPLPETAGVAKPFAVRPEAEPLAPSTPDAPAAADLPEARRTALATVASKVAACKQCALCEKRQQTVPGQGQAIAPDILFLGEAPGAEEDEQGQPFVGKAGQLLTKMIEAMGYTREQVFITNICKCRPPGDRPPSIEEMQACLPYLRSQLAAIRPRVIVALGATTVKGLFESNTGVSRLRGTWTHYANIPLMPTYHPTYLLRYPLAKKNAWEDLQKVLVKLGKPLPAKKKTEA